MHLIVEVFVITQPVHERPDARHLHHLANCGESFAGTDPIDNLLDQGIGANGRSAHDHLKKMDRFSRRSSYNRELKKVVSDRKSKITEENRFM
jgi:hypothetical protein